MFKNGITARTNGLTHDEAKAWIQEKVNGGYLGGATLIGYRDACEGIYDKYWRYDTNEEHEYLMGVQAAINNGAVIERYIEIGETKAA